MAAARKFQFVGSCPRLCAFCNCFLFTQAEDLIAATQKKDAGDEDQSEANDAETLLSSGVDTDDEVSLTFNRITATTVVRRRSRGSGSASSVSQRSAKSQKSDTESRGRSESDEEEVDKSEGENGKENDEDGSDEKTEDSQIGEESKQNDE